ncbi:hypothetical protein KAR91_11605 [Candidatus Pacearchaeota archaeon]|nr:hypothetical protein [Candidatus Pacearchaeota archaeon]
MKDQLEIIFVEYNLESFLDACLKIINQGAKKILLRPFNQFANELVNKVVENKLPVSFYAFENELEVPPPENLKLSTADEIFDASILFTHDAKNLSSRLMEYIDLKQGVIIAPITNHYFKNKPLFLISIPKSGTHLLYELVQAFGYRLGVVCPDNPVPGFWYCLEYSNSHTSARDFFIDTVRRSPFGNRHHPFTQCPAIFTYRHPMDIVVSEANYYHKEGNTVFYSYLNSLSFEERLLKLIDDPLLLGSIRDRIENFLAWLEFQNVIPVSFEEMVGPKGGGNINIQTRLIWSLQLKLHVSGNPRHYGEQTFNKESPTFHKGQIGTYKKYFTEQAYEKFYSLPQDFMNLLGYTADSDQVSSKIPNRSEEFRKRPLLLGESSFYGKMIPIEYDYLGFNIVRYHDRYYGIPKHLGPVDLTNREDVDWSIIYIADDMNFIKREILLGQFKFKSSPTERLFKIIYRLLLSLDKILKTSKG